jgi:hypothetical protein
VIITDEMVEKAMKAEEASWEHTPCSLPDGMRAALEAVAPDIRNQVIEEIALRMENGGPYYGLYERIRSFKSKP